MDPVDEVSVSAELSNRARVLHVTETLNGESEALTDALRTAGGEVELCGDVYRALAWLGRAEAPFHAVVLNLNWLARDDYEFVSQVARGAPSVPVFVYGGLVDADRINEALSLGALGKIDARPEVVARVVAPALRADSAAGGRRPAPDGGDVAPPAEGEERAGVPVPWREAAHRPSRTRPREEEDQTQSVGAQGAAGSVPNVPIEDGPLLSAEEIRLLLYGEKVPGIQATETEGT